MSYEPTEWKAGDVVTPAKLNKIEQGIKDSGNYVLQSTEEILNMTWQDIFNIGAEGKTIVYKDQFSEMNVKTAITTNYNYPYILIIDDLNTGNKELVFSSMSDITFTDMLNNNSSTIVVASQTSRLFSLKTANGELKDLSNNLITPKLLRQLMQCGYMPIIMKDESEDDGVYFSYIKFISNDYTRIITEDGDNYIAETDVDPYILGDDQN